MQRHGKLAIDGGEPVRKVPLPYGRHEVVEADVCAVANVLRSDWLTCGPAVEEFEADFGASVGALYAVSFSSGTAALHAAAHVAGLGPGDEAITSPLTFCATANALLYQGAVPVFADVREDTLVIDPQCVEQRLSPRTRAIVPVDYAGHPADIDALRDIADNHDLLIIEDAAHAVGALYRDRPVGALADMTTFSLHPVKHVAAGEGGVVTTRDSELAKALRRFRNHGIETSPRERARQGRWDYDMSDLGFNYRLSDISCALARSQLQRLGANLLRRQEIADTYHRAFRDLPLLRLPTVDESVVCAWHLYPVRLETEQLTGTRDEILNALRSEGILASVHYLPVYWHSYYRGRFGDRKGLAPVAEAAWSRLISLPIFHGMSREDVCDVIAAVRKVLAHFC